MSEPQYSAIHMTRIDAEIFATRVGRVAGAMYLQEDAKASDLMAGAVAWDHRMVTEGFTSFQQISNMIRRGGLRRARR